MATWFRRLVGSAPVTRDPGAFTDPDNWVGGFYELSIQLGDRDDERLHRAVAALWRAAGIDGCFSDRTREPNEQEVVPLTVDALARGRLHGHIRLPDGPVSVCGCFVNRTEDGTDWLDLYLPMGALVRVDPRIGGFPFGADGGPSSLTWRRALDEWLATIGAQIYREVPFQLGLIGFETDDAEFTSGAESASGAAVVPDRRSVGYLVPSGDQVSYHPANI